MHGIEKFVYTYAVLLAVFLVFAGVSTVSAQAPVWEDCSGPQFGGGGCIPGWVYPMPAPDCVWDDCNRTSTGPGPCVPGWVCPVAPPVDSGTPVGPAEMCLGASGCFPVRYSPFGLFMIAESVLPNGYPTMGWSGPCFFEREICPDIGNQAHSDLRLNALRIHRGLRFGQ